jgi:Protein of unknown function (DUF1571)
MGRWSVAVACAIAAVGGGLAYRYWAEPAEQTPAPVEEQAVTSTAVAAPVTEADRVRRTLVAGVSLAPGLGFPGTLPWQPMVAVGSHGGCTLENLLHAHPLLFLQLCADRFDAEVKGYTCTFVKKERIDGKLFPPGKDEHEVIKVACREVPFSVLFQWEKHRKLAARALYVEGQNDDKILARPFVTLLPIMERALDDPDAKKSGRYTMAEFGMGIAVKRTRAAMRIAEARGTLHVRYLGEFKLKEAGDRVCHKFIRTPYDPLEEDALNELTIYIDRETWLQVGSILRDPQGHLLAEYFFRDIVTNPTFSENQFTRKAL